MGTDLVRAEEFKGNLQSSNLYELLGVSKDATPTEIRRAYRKAAQKYHPDRNGGTEEAKAIFQDIQKAYETLSDPMKREFYDNTGMRKPEADKITENAKETVLQVFLQIIDQATDPKASVVFEYFDAVAEARQAIQGSLNNMHKMRADFQKQISKLQAMEKRFKKKVDHESSPLAIIFYEKIKNLKAKYSMSEVDVEVHKQALAYVDEYSCTPDTRPMNEWITTQILQTGPGGMPPFPGR